MKELINTFTFVFALIILIISIINVYTYYSDIKKVQELQKQKLRLEIQKLKQAIQEL